jgi:hypothetical protein
MKEATAPIEATFKQNVESVYRLMEFDNFLIEFCSGSFSRLVDRLKNAGIDNAITASANKSLDQLKRVRENESLRSQYAEMFNQSLVLLVSYFGLTIRDLFKACFVVAIKSGELGKLQRHDVKIPLQELQLQGEDFAEKLAEIFVAQKDISFQDMQSISRSFKEYFGYEPARDKNVNNIILAQACRHAIVHSGASVDAKLLKQVNEAKPRDLKLSLTEGQKIQLEPDDIKSIGQSMLIYVNSLCTGLANNWGHP